MPMKNIRNVLRNLSLLTMSAVCAVVIGVFCVYNSKIEDVENVNDIPVVNYSSSTNDDFYSGTSVENTDNMLKESSLAGEENFNLVLDKTADSISGFTFNIDENRNGFYEEEERGFAPATTIAIDRGFSQIDPGYIEFTIIPNKGKDTGGFDANAFYVSSMKIYTAETYLWDARGATTIGGCSSQYGVLNYSGDGAAQGGILKGRACIVGDIQFQYECVNNQTGELKCRLSKRGESGFLGSLNYKIEFKISYRDNVEFANGISFDGRTDIISTRIEGGDYGIDNVSNTFSVDDKLSVEFNPGSKIVNTIKVYQGTRDSNALWFTIYGGVAGGSGAALNGDVQDIVTYNNFALGIRYEENYLEAIGETAYGRLTNEEIIRDASGNTIGKRRSVHEDNMFDHRHKFSICLYDNGVVVIEKVGNECSLFMTATTQNYFIVNLQDIDAVGNPAASVEPYYSVTVSVNGRILEGAGAGAVTKTTYMGVSDSPDLIDIRVVLKDDYEWYSSDGFDPSYITDGGAAYQERFYGGIRSLTAVSTNRKYVNLEISVHLYNEATKETTLLQKSDLDILIGLQSQELTEDDSCFGVGNGGVGRRTFAMGEEDLSVACKYTIKLPGGLEIYKYNITSGDDVIEESLDSPKMFGVSDQFLLLTDDTYVKYFVRVVQIGDVVVENPYIDVYPQIGELKLHAQANTREDFFVVEISVYYKDLSRLNPEFELLNLGNSPTKAGYKFLGFRDKNALHGESDTFIDVENDYVFSGLLDYTGYYFELGEEEHKIIVEINNPSQYYAWLYAHYREDFSALIIYPVFEAITYTNHVVHTAPQKNGAEEPPVEVVTTMVTYDDTKFYVSQEFYTKTGYHVIGITNEATGDVLFASDELLYDEELEMYYYTLQKPWNIEWLTSFDEGYIFDVLLGPNIYTSSTVVAELTNFKMGLTEKLDTISSDIAYDSEFKMIDILASYTGSLKCELPGYKLIGFVAIAEKDDEIDDGAIEYEGIALINHVLVEKNVTYVSGLHATGTSYKWRFLRHIKFIPVFAVNEFTITLHAGDGNKFDSKGTTVLEVKVEFNTEVTDSFIETNFPPIYNRINGYDFDGFYMLTAGDNVVHVLGSEKAISEKEISYKSKTINEKFTSGWIDNFIYEYGGTLYWGVTKNIDLYVKLIKVDYDITVEGLDVNGSVADMSNQTVGVYEKDTAGKPIQVGEDITYETFRDDLKTLNISNGFALKALGDEGTFVKKLIITYNSVFEPDNFRVGYEFEFACDKNGKMTRVSGSEVKNLIYYDKENNMFYIDIEKVVNSETEKYNTVSTISDIKIELEYAYRTYVVGFQTGAYGLGLESLATPSSADVAYYLVNYNTRNDYSTWIPCTGDGVEIEHHGMWQEIGFLHNYDMVMFEEGSLIRDQEIDIVISSTPYFFCYWARLDKDGNVEPLSWDWSEGNANTANSEDGGSLIYYSVFTRIADINVYYYTWDPVAKEDENQGGYVSSAQKGYFWFKENQDGSFKTVNTYEKYKIGNHTYYITGWLWMEDNIDDAGTFIQGVYYDKKNNMFVDSYTGELIGSDNVPASYLEILERCTVKYRGDTTTDETKIKIYCYAVYSLYEYEVEADADATNYELKMRVPNDYSGNSYTETNNYWAAVSSERYRVLLQEYLTLKDVINSGELEVFTLEALNGKTTTTKSEVESLLVDDKDLLICYYSRNILSNTQTVVAGAICVGTKTADGFKYGQYDRVGSYADGTLVGCIDDIVVLEDIYITAYTNAVDQMKARNISGTEFSKRELIVKITLQLLQWNASVGDGKTKGFVFSESAKTVGLTGCDLSIEECIAAITSKDGEKILISSEGFVRLVYALAAYSIDPENPATVYGLFGADALGVGSPSGGAGGLSGDLKSGDILLCEEGPVSVKAIWLYSFRDASGKEYCVIANCRNITKVTELVGNGRNCIVSENGPAHNDGVFTYTYAQFVSYI